MHRLVPARVWEERYGQINDFERILTANGTRLLKLYLHIGKREQEERLAERLRDPSRHWKVNPQDFAERKRWNEYQKAYEALLSRCSTAAAPWYAVPANRKWYRNLVVSELLVASLEAMKPSLPKPDVAASRALFAKGAR